MAHALTQRANGFVEMAYRGAKGWHGLGNEILESDSIEDITRKAGMDWRVQRAIVRFNIDREGTQAEMPDQHVLFRSDTKAPLGITSDSFKIVQPADVIGFFRDLTGAAGFTIDTAGTLFGGRRLWALASIGERAIITNPADIVGGYLLLCTGTDGTLATTAKFTTVRVVCNNTLGMALSDGANQVRVTHRSTFDPSVAKDQLGIGRGQFAEFIRAAREMSRIAVNQSTAESLTLKLLSKGGPANDDDVRDSKGYKTVLALFNGQGKGARMDGVAGTAWGWVNAVTETVDYYSTARTVDNRVNSAWFGAGDTLKTRAVELALAA